MPSMVFVVAEEVVVLQLVVLVLHLLVVVLVQSVRWQRGLDVGVGRSRQRGPVPVVAWVMELT